MEQFIFQLVLQFLFVLGILFAVPALTISSINYLFDKNIVLSAKTWFCSFWIVLLITVPSILF